MTSAMSKSHLWSLLRKSGEVLAGVVLPRPDRAETIRWYEGTGHYAGQITDWQEACGLMARLRIEGSRSDGRWLIRVELFNPEIRAWRGGVALSDTVPTASEAVLTIGAGSTAEWWTYLSPQPCVVFVRLDDDALMQF